jgi:hypothetical protein
MFTTIKAAKGRDGTDGQWKCPAAPNPKDLKGVLQMAKSKTNNVVHSVQSIAGGKVRLTKDKWITEIDARAPAGLVASMVGAVGNGWSCRVDLTKAGARFRTLLPHAEAAVVLASIAAHAMTGARSIATPAHVARKAA